MSKVLLVDTNFSSMPIYEYLVSQGHQVYVAGNNPNDTLAKFAENYLQFDYSDIDRTRDIVHELKVDYLVPGCNDRSYGVCAALNEEQTCPGIDSLEASETLINKRLFREFCLEHNLPVPRPLDPQQVGMPWPVIVKPVDAYSGRGVAILHETQKCEIEAAMLRACEFSRTQSCIVEEHVEGQLFSHSAFVEAQEIVLDLIVEEHSTANAFAVDTSRVVHDFPYRVLKAVRQSVNTLARSLKMTDGLVHTQFICNRDRIWLIEVTRRCPGDLYSKLIELSTGLNYAENYARPFVDQRFRFSSPRTHPAWVMRHTVSESEDLVLAAVRFLTPLQIERLIPISQTGDRVRASPFGRIAILFAKTDTKEDLDRLFARTLARQLYTVLPFASQKEDV